MILPDSNGDAKAQISTQINIFLESRSSLCRWCHLILGLFTLCCCCCCVFDAFVCRTIALYQWNFFFWYFLSPLRSLKGFFCFGCLWFISFRRLKSIVLWRWALIRSTCTADGYYLKCRRENWNTKITLVAHVGLSHFVSPISVGLEIWIPIHTE